MLSSSKSDDSVSHRHHRKCCHYFITLCAALLLSLPATSLFVPVAPVIGKSTLAPRSGVIQRYRVEDEESYDIAQPKHQSDALSFLPTRFSSIERMDKPSHFQTQVLEEEYSLVVVRFYAEACPSCRATRPLFTKWSRDLETNEKQSRLRADASIQGSQQDPLPIKILEMPLNKATSTFIKDQLQVERLPYCHLYHPQFGMVKEQLVLNKLEFKQFVNAADCWSKGDWE